MKEMKKWKIVALCTVLACLSIVASGTLAYFTAQETAHNVITSGGVAIQLIELSDNGGDGLTRWEKVEGVMPGAEISKIVIVKNTGASDAWVRVKVDKTIELADGVEGTPDPSLMKLYNNNGDSEWIEQDGYEGTFWTKGEDGYYYYKNPLAPGYETPALFTTVTFAPAMGNEYQNCTATIDVKADAVQVANNGDTVLDATGWPA